VFLSDTERDSNRGPISSHIQSVNLTKCLKSQALIDVGWEPQNCAGQEGQFDDRRGDRSRCEADRQDGRLVRSGRERSSEASPSQVEVGLGHAFGGAERDDRVVAGSEAFEAFDSPPGSGGVRTGARGRVGHEGILQEKERMPSTIINSSST